MSLLPTIGAVDQDTGFYNGAATQSLRVSYVSAESYLTKTPDASNRKTHTLSFWLKRSKLGATQSIIRAAGNSDTTTTDIWFDSNDKLEYMGTSSYWRVTNQVFRDTSAWYHFVIVTDTVQSGATFDDANTIKIYVNGTQVTSFSDTANMAEDTAYGIGGNVAHTWGKGLGNFDGYFAEINFIDGLALDEESFGEFKNGAWIAKKYSGAYGTEGYHLEFKQTATGTAGTGTIGADTSGLNNHFTSSGMDVWDSAMPDSPENNFSTMNPLVKTSGTTAFTEGNLKIVQSTANYSFMQSNFSMRTGKWYAECRVNAISATVMIGVTNQNMSTYRTGAGIDPHGTTGTVWYVMNGNGYVEGSSQGATNFTDTDSYGANDVIGVALDLDSGTKNVKFYLNGTQVNSTDLASTFTDHIGFANNIYNGATVAWNFGQDSSFFEEETATTNADDNGIGAFHHAPPSGFLAVCSANFSEPLISANSDTQANDHMQAVIYEGDTDGTDGAQNIAVNFKPDLTWIKNRDATDPHQLFDSSRGATFPFAVKEASVGETANDDTLTDFIGTGFTLGDDVNVNTNDESYVSWNWKANAAVSTGSGAESGDNPKFDHQSNTLAGFSIVEYEGTGANGTFAHGVQVDGVDAAPACIWFKHIQGEDSWAMWHHTAVTANSQYIPLNTVNGLVADTNLWNTGVPSTTIINLGTNSLVNRNLGSPSGQGKFVCYCFAEIDGYSKFGIYTGNNNANGAVVFTNFKPAFVLTKRADGGTGNWYINDTARSLFNPTTPLYFNLNNVESGNGIDILSNGFKIRNADAGQNAAGIKYLYMAFAEESFKYANAE